MEFPAVGYRYSSDGSLGNAGTCSRYWSSVAYDSINAYYLYFVSSNVSPQDHGSKRYGLSVRCVR
ncbi:MAG: fibrobacter succinogenes major paralogous domain-containing protein [Rikenellaceae bacterium]|nr:fibrobacter succinogenes major paralogous domain-containing protein [Rikenellaceae bacterium]